MLDIKVVEALTQFGVAGLMGVLWVWERVLSRRRDRQLSEAHDRLMEERDQIRVLVRLVRRNTAAIERFARSQEQIAQLLGRVQHEIESRGKVG